MGSKTNTRITAMSTLMNTRSMRTTLTSIPKNTRRRKFLLGRSAPWKAAQMLARHHSVAHGMLRALPLRSESVNGCGGDNNEDKQILKKKGSVLNEEIRNRYYCRVIAVL